MKRQDNPVWTAIDPGLASLLCREHSERDELPLAIRRFIEQHEAASIVEAARRVTDRVLEQYQQGIGSANPPVRLSRIAQLQAVTLRGLHNVTPTRMDARARRQRYRAAITMGPDNVVITIPPGSDRARARISVAHELGHLLIHSRGGKVDEVTVRLGSSVEEEALAEYLGRLILLSVPIDYSEIASGRGARLCFDLASSADVPLTTALLRLGDPDQSLGVAGVILWELRGNSQLSVAERLKPYCRFCGKSFIPHRSRAREGSFIAVVGEGEEEKVAIGEEFVRIGTFVGNFRVEAYSWGSVDRGTRKVLSIFSFLR